MRPDVFKLVAICTRKSKKRGKFWLGGWRQVQILSHIPLHPQLREALEALLEVRGESVRPDRPVINSEHGRGLSGASVAVWFHRLYPDLGLEGCSSHSGRRTFVAGAVKKCIEAGGSLRDVQQLADRSHVAMTQTCIEGDNEAKRRLVAMI